MARLIDADALKATFQKWANVPEYNEAERHIIRAAMIAVDDCPTIGGWISVKDRLPGEDGRYLVYNMFYCNAVVTIASFSTCLENEDEYDFDGEKRPGWFSYDDEYGYYEINGVTHWMPLPEPPKEDN